MKICYLTWKRRKARRSKRKNRIEAAATVATAISAMAGEKITRIKNKQKQEQLIHYCKRYISNICRIGSIHADFPPQLLPSVMPSSIHLSPSHAFTLGNFAGFGCSFLSLWLLPPTCTWFVLLLFCARCAYRCSLTIGGNDVADVGNIHSCCHFYVLACLLFPFNCHASLSKRLSKRVSVTSACLSRLYCRYLSQFAFILTCKSVVYKRNKYSRYFYRMVYLAESVIVVRSLGA